jgi:hypothetical protein
MGIFRTKTKVGDIFFITLDNGNKVYFQYIANDLTQLNSDVIRVFKSEYPPNVEVDFSQLLQGEIDFHAHTMINVGVKQNYYNKIGNSKVFPDFDNIIFRDVDDLGLKIGEKPVLVSEKWFVWRINDKDFKFIGKLKDEYKHAEIGIVMPPIAIVERIKTGKFSLVYPD